MSDLRAHSCAILGHLVWRVLSQYLEGCLNISFIGHEQFMKVTSQDLVWRVLSQYLKGCLNISFIGHEQFMKVTSRDLVVRVRPTERIYIWLGTRGEGGVGGLSHLSMRHNVSICVVCRVRAQSSSVQFRLMQISLQRRHERPCMAYWCV